MVGLTGIFQWGMRQWSESGNEITAVEKIVDYTDVVLESTENGEKPEGN